MAAHKENPTHYRHQPHMERPESGVGSTNSPFRRIQTRETRNPLIDCPLRRSPSPVNLAPTNRRGTPAFFRRNIKPGSSYPFAFSGVLFSCGFTVLRTTINLFSGSNQNGAPNEIASAVINHPAHTVRALKTASFGATRKESS